MHQATTDGFVVYYYRAVTKYEHLGMINQPEVTGFDVRSVCALTLRHVAHGYTVGRSPVLTCIDKTSRKSKDCTKSGRQCTMDV